mgnify:CR=1 FL=1
MEVQKVRVRHYQVTSNVASVTSATIDGGPGEPQTTVMFRCNDWGVDLLVTFTPTPKAFQRLADVSEAKRLA